MSAERDDEWVLARVHPHGLDQDTVIAYEVAVELLNQVIAGYAARVGRHERTPDADARTVASLRADLSRYVELLNRLRPGDRELVEQVRRECAAIIRGFVAARPDDQGRSAPPPQRSGE